MPPGAIAACVPGAPFASHAKSIAVNDALFGGESPAASVGIAPASTPSAPASGR